MFAFFSTVRHTMYVVYILCNFFTCNFQMDHYDDDDAESDSRPPPSSGGAGTVV